MATTVDIALIGLGNVGRGFLRILETKRERLLAEYGLALRVICVADSSGVAVDEAGFDPAMMRLHKENGGRVAELAGFVPGQTAAQVLEKLAVGLVLEASPVDLQTGEPGLGVTRTSLQRGITVVLANKGPLVLAFAELQVLARANGAGLGYSATVCGALPVINIGQRDLVAAEITELAGIFNATTNFIEGAERIEVSFGDQLSAPAKVVGYDARNDVAVVKVSLQPAALQPVVLGESEHLQVGQWAIAIGNPFGQFGRTLTTGVISALGRSLEGPDGRTISDVIQTDAAINKGNSGGPLLDSSGRVIGINSAIFSPTGTSAGVGFALPVDTIKRMLPDLLAIGRYRHPWLGVRYAYNITPGLAEVLKLPTNTGLLLVQLYGGSPLAGAGVLGAQREDIIGNQRVYTGGDILVAADGQAITNLDQLESLLEKNYRVGDSVTLTIIREGQTRDVTVELVEEPAGG